MEMREIWDEFRWEEFMREQDRKVDRYMELFYRYRNDPKRDEIIAREMGWTWLLQEDHRARLADLSPATDDELDEGDEWKTRIEPSDDLPAAFSGFELLPVYQNAKNFSLRAFHYVDRLPEHRRADSAVVDFLSNAIVAASKIAGGTGLGDAREELGGNIAYCKRGLAAANLAIAALHEMKQKNILPDSEYFDIVREAVDVRNAIALHILDLREKFQQEI